MISYQDGGRYSCKSLQPSFGSYSNILQTKLWSGALPTERIYWNLKFLSVLLNTGRRARHHFWAWQSRCLHRRCPLLSHGDQINLLFRTISQLPLSGPASTQYPVKSFLDKFCKGLPWPFWRLLHIQHFIWPSISWGGILIFQTQASSGRPVEYIDVQRTAQMGSLKPFIERNFFAFQPQ